MRIRSVLDDLEERTRRFRTDDPRPFEWVFSVMVFIALISGFPGDQIWGSGHSLLYRLVHFSLWLGAGVGLWLLLLCGRLLDFCIVCVIAGVVVGWGYRLWAGAAPERVSMLIQAPFIYAGLVLLAYWRWFDRK